MKIKKIMTHNLKNEIMDWDMGVSVFVWMTEVIFFKEHYLLEMPETILETKR